MGKLNSPRNPFTIWSGDGFLGDWRDAVCELVVHTHYLSGMPAVRELNEIIDKAGGTKTELGRLLDGRITSALDEVRGAGVIFGWALARTQPERLEDFDQWIDRAAELAAFPWLDQDDEDEQPEPPEAA